MVSGGRRPLTAPRRRAIIAWLATALLVWWCAHASGTFFVVGLGAPWSEWLGPLLPAICAGLTVTLTLSIVDGAAGAVAGIAAAVVVLLLPGFVPLHRASLTGPPLLTLTVATLGVMLYAPRFSLAYGTLAALAAVQVAQAGIGLPAAAAAWALLADRQRTRGAGRRVALAVVPLLILVVLSRWTGDGWPHGEAIAWRGGLDRAFRAAGEIIGDQLAPGIRSATLRWFLIADGALLLIAVVVVAWRRVVRMQPHATTLRRLYPAAGVLALAYAAGLAMRTLLLTGTPEPDLAAVFPLALLCALMSVTSIAVLWPRWPRAGKIVAVVLMLGWMQAALRG